MKTVLSVILAIVGLAFLPMFLWGLSGILRLNFGLIYMFMLGFSTTIECGVICAIKALNKQEVLNGLHQSNFRQSKQDTSIYK